MFRFSYLILVFFLLYTGCRDSESSLSRAGDVILQEKNLIPEGTAFNRKSGSVYVGSIYKQKVLEIKENGLVQDVVDKDAFGILSPLGLEFDADNNLLWINMSLAPIVNESDQNQWKTGLMSYDLQAKKWQHYILSDTLPSFFNDLTLLKNGNIIITETANARLFMFNSARNKLELFLNLEKYHFPNGITFHERTGLLFVSCNEGILKINIKNKTVSLIETEKGINATSIDGLSFHGNYFIGHQSSKIEKFYVDESFTRIFKSETLDSGKEFDSSTTGAIGDGYYHYIVNSQIKSGIEKRRIKPLDSLEYVIIRTQSL